MKVICVMLSLLFVSIPSNAEIKNGYSKNIEAVIEQLQFLHDLKNGQIQQLNGSQEWEDLDLGKKVIVKKKIKSLNSYLKYYLLTELLIDEFRTICPDIYSEINNIKNHDSQETDVYIKIVQNYQELNEISGATIVSRDPEDVNICVSEYGKNTISIKVCSGKNILKVLAHEMGHVNFIVPNLSRYIEYCNFRHNPDLSTILTIYHETYDIGYKNVIEYERRFNKANKKYLADENKVAFSPKKILKELNKQSNLEQIFLRIMAKNHDYQ